MGYASQIFIPQHEVTITKPSTGKFTVTQEQYEEVVGAVQHSKVKNVGWALLFESAAFVKSW